MNQVQPSGTRKVIFVNSHPIQYFAPLYKYLNQAGVATECWYCSDENVKGHLDKQFGVQVKWDIPILDGYKSRFFRNRSWRPSLYSGFFGLINPGMIRALFREDKSVVIVHGWSYFTHIMVLIVARMAGHVVCLRGESPLNQELVKKPGLRFFKGLGFKLILFPWVNRFLYIGAENKAFYKHYGVGERQLVFTPYAVDNQFFIEAARRLVPEKAELRKRLQLPETATIFLFTGKFIGKKRPMDLVKAFEALELGNKCLVLVGDGNLRQELEQYVSARGVQQVFFPGFVNQTEIVNYYAVADVFVLCSGIGETWGLSVNEAMNFNLPVVVSDTVGCADDLVVEGKSGFTFPEGDTRSLALAMRNAVLLSPRSASADLVAHYSFEAIRKSLTRIQE